MRRDEFLNTYWRYYKSLEKDFENTLKYVSLSDDNFDTYSIEYARLLQDICSEIEVLMKEICEITDRRKHNYFTLLNQILENDSNFIDHTVFMNKYTNYDIQPFFTNNIHEITPVWWQAHNNIKHLRKQYMRNSTQKNVLDSLAALFLLEDYLIKKIAYENDEVDIVDEPSSLFNSDLSKKYMWINENLFAEVVNEKGITYIM